MPLTSLKLLRKAAIPRDILSLNISECKHWASPAKSWKQKREWWKWLRSDEGLKLPILHDNNKRTVVIKRIISGRMQFFDKVNLYGGVKPLEDALILLGWIKDDAKEWCELNVQQLRIEDASAEEQKEVKTRKAKIFVEIYE